MAAARRQDLIVVGVDRSRASAGALRWAATEAALRHSGLIITHLETLDAEAGHFAHVAQQERLLARSAQAVALTRQGIPVSTHLIAGGLQEIGDELLRLSQRAPLIVLRRLRVEALHLQGPPTSIQGRLIAAASCPVVVVPATAPAGPAPALGVVVTCDPGDDDNLLDLAAVEAQLRGVPPTIIEGAVRELGNGRTAGAARTRRHLSPGLVASVVGAPDASSSLALAQAGGADLLVVDCCDRDGCRCAGPSRRRLSTTLRTSRCPLMLVNDRSQRGDRSTRR